MAQTSEYESPVEVCVGICRGLVPDSTAFIILAFVGYSTNGKRPDIIYQWGLLGPGNEEQKRK